MTPFLEKKIEAPYNTQLKYYFKKTHITNKLCLLVKLQEVWTVFENIYPHGVFFPDSQQSVFSEK